MELTERKKKVLRSIVDLYSRTAEPVGSKAVAELPDMQYSSATILNEMAELTTMGYLEQPHTSAGRIPSPVGYRLYVDELMSDYRLSLDESRSIAASVEEKMQQVDATMEKVARLVSQATNLPAISVASRSISVTVKRFDLIFAGQGSIILVVMLSTEELKNKLLRLPVAVEEQDLKLLSAVLNATMTEMPLSGFTPELMDRVSRSAGNAAALVPVITDYTVEVLRAQEDASISVTGQMRLLGQPEYRDVDKAQKVLTGLDEKMITQLPAVMENANGTRVIVGPENLSEELKDTSVVVTKFDIGDGMQGMIGVVGPTRMDYAKVTARLSCFAESLSKMFGKPEQASLPQGSGEVPEHKEAQ